MDGPAPDSGTCWEVGYAFGTKKSIVLVRTDYRAMAGNAGEYNPMLTQAATIRLGLPAASTTEVVSAILEALARIEAGSGALGTSHGTNSASGLEGSLRRFGGLPAERPHLMGSANLLRQDGLGGGWRVSTPLFWPVRSCGRPCARWS
jgi:hypothetical protein